MSITKNTIIAATLAVLFFGPTFATENVEPTARQSTGIVQKEFFPELSKDLKIQLIKTISKNENPLRLARTCKAWYKFLLGREIERGNHVQARYKDLPDYIQHCLEKIWWVQEDVRIFNNSFIEQTTSQTQWKLSDLNQNSSMIVIPKSSWDSYPILYIMNDANAFLLNHKYKNHTLLILVISYRQAQVAIRLAGSRVEYEHFSRIVNDHWDISETRIGIFIRHARHTVTNDGFYYCFNHGFTNPNSPISLRGLLNVSVPALRVDYHLIGCIHGGKRCSGLPNAECYYQIYIVFYFRSK